MIDGPAWCGHSLPVRLDRNLFRLPRGRQLILCLLPLAVLQGILAGLRWPQAYTVSHLVIDYHFGFGKRGLIGAVLEHLDHAPYHYATLAWLAFAVMAIWIALLIIVSWRTMRADTGVAAAVLLFFISVSFASLVCDAGRGEHFGLVLALLCLLAPAGTVWLAARALALLAAVLMHEANFVILAPVLAFDTWACRRAGPLWRPRPEPGWRAVAAACITIMPALAATIYLGNIRTACDLAQASGYFQHLAADFHVLEMPVLTLCLDGTTNLRMILRSLWSDGEQLIVVPLALAVTLPGTVFNVWLGLRVLRGRRVAQAVCVLAAAAPATLTLVGIDVVRFVTMMQLTSLLVLISASRRLGVPQDGTLPAPLRSAVALTALAAIELGSSIHLNDGAPMERFPFHLLTARLAAIIHGTAPFMIIPRL